jgi:hypothetical protein
MHSGPRENAHEIFHIESTVNKQANSCRFPLKGIGQEAFQMIPLTALELIPIQRKAYFSFSKNLLLRIPIDNLSFSVYHCPTPRNKMNVQETRAGSRFPPKM